MIDFEKYPLPKRMRHHISPSVYLPITELKFVPEWYPELIEEVDWSTHFQNAKPPSILDIGCGRGRFLFDLSFNLPEENLLGIEVRPLPADWIRSVIDAEKLPNISVLRYSVANGLQFIADSSVSKIFYLFPDPWQKKKHFKRRAFNMSFVEEVYRLLDTNGTLNLATDVPEIHEYHLELLNEFGKFDIHLVESDSEWEYPITNKEDFCRKNAIPFYRLVCTKNSIDLI